MCGLPGMPITAVTRPPATAGPRFRKCRFWKGSSRAVAAADAWAAAALNSKTNRSLIRVTLDLHRKSCSSNGRGASILLMVSAICRARGVGSDGCGVAFDVSLEPIDPPLVGLHQVLRFSGNRQHVALAWKHHHLRGAAKMLDGAEIFL